MDEKTSSFTFKLMAKGNSSKIAHFSVEMKMNKDSFKLNSKERSFELERNPTERNSRAHFYTHPS